MPSSVQKRLFAVFEWAFIAAGLGFRLWQFCGNAALFVDEVGVARNVAARSWSDLLRPLDFGQVAPAGFLWLERLAWLPSHQDWALRVVALISALASLFLFRTLAHRALEDYGRVVAIGLFACAVPPIRYASWVKQYSSDTAIAIALLLLTVRLVEPSTTQRQRIVAGVVGLVAMFFSSSAVFVVAGSSVVVVALAIANQLPNRRDSLRFIVIPWLVGALVATLFATHSVSPDTMSYMKEYWRSGFQPWPLRTTSDALWPWRAVVGVFTPTSLGYPLPGLYALLCISGFVLMWRKAPARALVMGGPIAATLGAAVFHRYPFADRLILFLTPLFLILLSANLDSLSTLGAGIARGAIAPVAALALLLGGVSRLRAEHPVYWVNDPRTTLREIGANRRAGDVIFAWHRAGPFLDWYGRRYGLSNVETIVGGCWWGDPQRFVADLDRVRGRARVWIIPGWGGAQSASALRRYADAIGVQTMQVRGAPHLAIRAWLYDFSDSTRLARATARDFPVTERLDDPIMLMNCQQAYKRPNAPPPNE